jgi:hypothetical protein
MTQFSIVTKPHHILVWGIGKKRPGADHNSAHYMAKKTYSTMAKET